jgi:SAM-dependent methyltransferase
LLLALEKLGFNNTTGVDISKVAIKYAKQITNNSNIFKANITNKLKLPNNYFDLIIDLTMTSSSHPYHWPKIYQEFNRLLKNDGYLISEMFIRSPNNPLACPLTKKSKYIPNGLDQIYGITKKEINSIIGNYFTIIQTHKKHPDHLGRFYILAQKQ